MLRPPILSAPCTLKEMAIYASLPLKRHLCPLASPVSAPRDEPFFRAALYDGYVGMNGMFCRTKLVGLRQKSSAVICSA